MSTYNVRYPEGPLLRSPADLDVMGVADEEVLHVSTARVAIADYTVLQHDFPELRTENLSLLNPELLALDPVESQVAVNAIIDEWLITNAAFVSTSQAAHATVNTPIKVDGRRTNASRPPMYGRAVVLAVTGDHCSSRNERWQWSPGEGLLDLKGVGVAPHCVPSHGYRASGLEYLGMALSDFLLQKVVDGIFARELPTAWTVPVYAILDLGFDYVDGNLGSEPAGLHVRRAHRRFGSGPSDDWDTARKVTMDIELLLRRYGITSAHFGLQLHIRRHDGRVTWQMGAGCNPPFTARNVERVGLSLALLDKKCPLTIDNRDVQLARDVSWPPACAQMVDFGSLRVEARFDWPIKDVAGGLRVEDLLWPESPEFVQPHPELCLPLDSWRRFDLVMWCCDLARRFRADDITPRELRRTLLAPLRVLFDRWSTVDLEREANSRSARPCDRIGVPTRAASHSQTYLRGLPEEVA